MSHWLGYKILQPADGTLRLVGRGTLVLWAVGPLLVFIAVGLPITFAVGGFPNIVSSQDVVLAAFLLALLVLVCILGLFYLASCFPVASTVIFCGDTITRKDVYLRGKQENAFDLRNLCEIKFVAVLPHKSLLKLIFIRLIEKDGKTINLLHSELPMYSWQGRKAFQSMKTHLQRQGFSRLIQSEPDFNFF